MRIIQARTWVRPTAPTPMILPSSRVVGLTLEMTTSTMRLIFSSITERITIMP